MKYDLIAYSMDIASFLMQKLKDAENIKNIILFGSVAREEAEKNSDIDIFIDVLKESKKFEKSLNLCLERFFETIKYKEYWKPLGTVNEINLMVGILDNWPKLKPSIIANGITLYGKFKTNITGEHKALFIWENIKPNSKRVYINKKLFGFKKENKVYSGLVEKLGGERLGKGCIILPLDNYLKVQKLFLSHKVSVRIKNIIEYAK